MLRVAALACEQVKESKIVEGINARASISCQDHGLAQTWLAQTWLAQMRDCLKLPSSAKRFPCGGMLRLRNSWSRTSFK